MSTFKIRIKKVHDNPTVVIVENHKVLPETFQNTGWSSGLIQEDEIFSIANELRNAADTLEEFYTNQ